MDRITIIVTSLVSCAVISILLPWCLLCSIPITGLIFDYFSCKFLNGLSLVNAGKLLEVFLIILLIEKNLSVSLYFQRAY